MPESKIWKTVLKYVIGVVGLVTALVAAWFAPGWYNEWQDRQLWNQVTLDSRENIQFLDTESLDIAGRIRALGESVNFGWGISYYMEGYDSSENEIMEKTKGKLETWTECGLIPDIYPAIFKEPDFGEKFYIELDEGILPVYYLRFLGINDYSVLTVVMDSEKDFLYYVSVSGDAELNQNYMGECLGYDTWIDALTALWNGEEAKESRKTYNFAEVCGAKDAEVSSASDLDCDVVLKFENFNGYAGRRFVVTDAGCGIATMYGTERWTMFVREAAAACGYAEEYPQVRDWIDYGEKFDTFSVMERNGSVSGQEEEMKEKK